MQDNYETIAVKLADLTPFSGNSMSARRGLLGHYEVYSYNTCIARYFRAPLKPWLDTAKFSGTTTRHQNLVRRAWEL